MFTACWMDAGTYRNIFAGGYCVKAYAPGQKSALEPFG
jgi:hypothetical protein